MNKKLDFLRAKMATLATLFCPKIASRKVDVGPFYINFSGGARIGLFEVGGKELVLKKICSFLSPSIKVGWLHKFAFDVVLFLSWISDHCC